MEGVSLDLSPHAAEDAGRTCGLQKGVIMHLGGRPLCEEGMGFGVPVVVHGFDTYLAYTSEVTRESRNGRAVFKKIFLLDALERVRFRGRLLEHPIHYAWAAARSVVYRWCRPAQRLLPAVCHVSEATGVELSFRRCAPLARVPVFYEVGPDGIWIEVDLSDLRRLNGRFRAFVLNEQGANFFPHYEDSCGTSLERERIGGWAKVGADRGRFLAPDGRLGFALERQEGARLYRGWEHVPGGLAWAGLIYQVSGADRFSYTVSLIRQG